MANPISPKFPEQIPTDQDLLVLTNESYTNLSADITDLDTTIPVNKQFNVPCLLQIEDEFILALEYDNEAFTNVVRGYKNSTASVHPNKTPVYAYYDEIHHNRLAAEVKSLCTSLGTNLENVLKSQTGFSGDVSGTFDNIQVNSIHGIPYSLINNVVEQSHSPISEKAYYHLVSAPECELVNGAVLGSVALGSKPKKVVRLTEGQGLTHVFIVPPDFSNDIVVHVYWRSDDTSGDAQFNFNHVSILNPTSEYNYPELSVSSESTVTTTFVLSKDNLIAGPMLFNFTLDVTTLDFPVDVLAIGFEVIRMM